MAIAYYTMRRAGVDLEVVDWTGDGSGWGKPMRLSAETMRLDWLAPRIQGGCWPITSPSITQKGTRSLFGL
jgi:hypothetical protein